jgi:diguanylate cyclase (GGDEF)-like protein
MLVMTSLVYAAGAVVLFVFAQQGRIPFTEVIFYGSSALLILAAFFGLWHSKARLSFHDPTLQLPQLAMALILQAVFAARLPALLFAFAFSTLILMVFAALQLNVRRYIFLWVMVSASSGVIVALGTFDAAGLTALDACFGWIYFVLTLASLAIVSARICYLRDIVRERNRNMSATLNRYRQLLSHDELTHALSRRFFMEILDQTVAQSERYASGFCVAMIDLDHFKRVNDRYGHPVGDAVLCAVCEAAWATLRQVDQIGRYGGEEFAVLLPQCRLEDALVVLERVRINIAQTSLEHLAPNLQMTVSIGVTEYIQRDNVHSLLERADQALYQAKQKGRNQIRTL